MNCGVLVQRETGQIQQRNKHYTYRLTSLNGRQIIHTTSTVSGSWQIFYKAGNVNVVSVFIDVYVPILRTASRSRRLKFYGINQGSQ